MKFQSFVNFPKKIKELIKMLLHFWFFTCWFFTFYFFIFYFLHPFSFWTSLSVKRPYISFIVFILSLCSNALTLESIFEYYIKNKKNTLILKFHPGMKCLQVCLSFFHLKMKVQTCLFDRGEFIMGWGFISPKTKNM